MRILYVAPHVQTPSSLVGDARLGLYIELACAKPRRLKEIGVGKSGSNWHKHPVNAVMPPYAHRAVEPPEGPWSRGVGQVYGVYTPHGHLPLCPGYASMLHPAGLQ